MHIYIIISLSQIVDNDWMGILRKIWQLRSLVQRISILIDVSQLNEEWHFINIASDTIAQLKNRKHTFAWGCINSAVIQYIVTLIVSMPNKNWLAINKVMLRKLCTWRFVFMQTNIFKLDNATFKSTWIASKGNLGHIR